MSTLRQRAYLIRKQARGLRRDRPSPEAELLLAAIDLIADLADTLQEEPRDNEFHFLCPFCGESIQIDAVSMEGDNAPLICPRCHEAIAVVNQDF
ncbi:MAG: hypothetical protein LBT44_02760 [Clostridiales bacterium]|jgi:predicted RNA-binding Zn-ribbon protein involved in translation (DUF1610 family)|nr:hypothetical protein [Clostridiales bacterium]